MTSFESRFYILPQAQRALWPDLTSVKKLGFVLYGGTALALRLGHRESVDFDFFSEGDLDKKALYEVLPFLEHAQTIQDERDTLTVLRQIGDNFVKVSFFGKIRFGRVGEPELTEDGVLQVASMLDLYGTKIKVLFDRVEVKDYWDIVALLRQGVALESGLGAAHALFGRAFQPSEALKMLTYFEGGDLNLLSHEDRALLIAGVAGVTEIKKLSVLSHSLSKTIAIPAAEG